MYIREDMAVITLTLSNPPANIGYRPPAGYSFSTYSGGELEADTSKTRPGNMGREVDVGGPASRGDATLTTQLTDLNWAWIDALDSIAGDVVNGACVVGVAYKRGRNATGEGFTRVGVLKSVTPPDFDSTGNEVTFLEVVVGLNE